MSAAQTIPIPVPLKDGMRRSSKWLNAVSHVDTRFGGIAKVVPELCAAVSGTRRCESMVVGFCDKAEEAGIQKSACTVNYVPRTPGLSRLLAGRTFPLRLLADADGLHVHGIWELHCRSAVRAARSARKPYVLSAHGMLEPWALRNKRFKKVIYSALIERENICGAACLHALTSAEAENYRQYGAKNPIAVIPNGVRIPEGTTGDLFLTRFPELRGKRLVMFLGRIHYKKGIDLLVRAWRRIAAAEPDTHLVLAGPDCENTQAPIEGLVASYNLSDSITFTGMLDGALKWSALAAAELFILPSWSEGFSVSVLEAMGMRKPVIITRQCNIPEVERYDCGWVIEPDAEQLAASIVEFLAMPAARTRTMAQNGASLVERRYNWSKIGEQMSALYEWVLSGGTPSGFELRRRGN